MKFVRETMLCLAIALIGAPALAQEPVSKKKIGPVTKSPAVKKEAEIRSLILLFEGINNAGRRYIQQLMLNTAKQKHQGMSQEQQLALMRDIEVYVAERAGKPFIDQQVIIYDKHYTTSEISDLLKFYKSPTGRKSLTVSPQIGRESVELAQQFAKEIYPGFELRFGTHISAPKKSLASPGNESTPAASSIPSGDSTPNPAN